MFLEYFTTGAYMNEKIKTKDKKNKPQKLISVEDRLSENTDDLMMTQYAVSISVWDDLTSVLIVTGHH